MTDTNLNRTAIRAMVEDYWQSFLSVARQTGDASLGTEMIQRFHQQVEATAALMSPEQADAFRQAITEETEIIGSEWERDRDAVRRRLGLSIDDNLIPSHGQGIGEMAVRTAVRATVWEAVFSLFRLFR